MPDGEGRDNYTSVVATRYMIFVKKYMWWRELLTYTREMFCKVIMIDELALQFYSSFIFFIPLTSRKTKYEDKMTMATRKSSTT